MTGIIYCYTSPSGKKYIWQTKNEYNRRYKFFHSTKYSNGGKIDFARKKYGPQNFIYEVLEKIENDNPEELQNLLNNKEMYGIDKFDTFNNGYNSTQGGASSNGELISKGLIGHKMSEESKQKIRESAINNNYIENLQKYSDKALENLRKKCNKPVLQYTLDGEFIKEGPSVTIASEALGYCRTAISDCGNKNKSSAYGFIWKLKTDTNPIKPIKKSSKIAQCDINGNIINIYNSAREAIETLNLDNCNNIKTRIDAINRCCKTGRIGYNYKGKYYDN